VPSLRDTIRAELLELGGEAADKEFLNLNRTMAYDPATETLDAMNLLLPKWRDIANQAAEAANLTTSTNDYTPEPEPVPVAAEAAPESEAPAPDPEPDPEPVKPAKAAAPSLAGKKADG
jgi:hypothetical protein